MKRRSFIKKAGVSAAIVGTGISAHAGTSNGATAQNFVHNVYFWMKDTLTADEKTFFLSQLQGFLKKVDVIQSYFIGEPANTPRNVVDNSYGIHLMVSFKSRGDQDTYQQHAAHKLFVEKCKDLWAKVIVYDSVPII